MILRPDSGDSVTCVLQALEAGEKVFGVDVNGKGYKVIRRMGVIQGDGINYDVIVKSHTAPHTHSSPHAGSLSLSTD